ncbi:Copper transport protein CTR1 [Spathaspora sp. JA1]|nr:Copper transport protein CTR1 [Spathaspora sp. JA1]
MSFQNKHMVMNTASATMDMVMETAMATMDHGSMDHGSNHSSEMAGMHMFFTTQFKNYPVIFENLQATTKAEAFGIFLLLFVVAFSTRLLEFVRNYLEEVVWQNENYHEFETGIAGVGAGSAPTNLLASTTTCGKDDTSEDSLKGGVNETSKPVKSLSVVSGVFRDIIRLFLCIVPDLFGYTLMLAAMTFTLTYFFAVVIGSGVGRFTSERLMERFRLKRTAPINCC